MQNDSRLRPWLELADDLESFDYFMHKNNLAPIRIGDHRNVQFLDVGAAVAQRMRAIAANRWTWYGWKRDGMQGEVRAKMHTLHRWIAEGFFYGCEETEAYKEMLKRMENIEQKFKQLIHA